MGMLRRNFDPNEDPICQFVKENPGCSRADVIRAVYQREPRRPQDSAYSMIKKIEDAGYIIDDREKPTHTFYYSWGDSEVPAGGGKSRLFYTGVPNERREKALDNSAGLGWQV